MSEKSSNPYDMDSPSFDSDRYLQKLLKVCLPFSSSVNRKENPLMFFL